MSKVKGSAGGYVAVRDFSTRSLGCNVSGWLVGPEGRKCVVISDADGFTVAVGTNEGHYKARNHLEALDMAVQEFGLPPTPEPDPAPQPKAEPEPVVEPVVAPEVEPDPVPPDPELSAAHFGFGIKLETVERPRKAKRSSKKSDGI